MIVVVIASVIGSRDNQEKWGATRSLIRHEVRIGASVEEYWDCLSGISDDGCSLGQTVGLTSSIDEIFESGVQDETNSPFLETTV